MKLQAATRYAIWATVHMAAHPNQQLSASDLAQFYGISQHHLAKVLRTLSMARILSSTRGPSGGCTFIADPKRVTLYDIIELFEGELWDSDRNSKVEARSPLAQEVGRVLHEIDHITEATLRSVTIQTLLNNAKRQQSRRQETQLRPAQVAAAANEVLDR